MVRIGLILGSNKDSHIRVDGILLQTSEDPLTPVVDDRGGRGGRAMQSFQQHPYFSVNVNLGVSLSRWGIVSM